jgi:hypothetical protein
VAVELRHVASRINRSTGGDIIDCTEGKLGSSFSDGMAGYVGN